MANFLTADEHQLLTQAERHDTGGYDNWHKTPRDRPFVVDIDARPLVALINATVFGVRVYEFMAIQRPGDLLHYLWVTIIALDDEVIQSVKESVAYRNRYAFDENAPLSGLSFVEFDRCFIWQGDDTDLEDACWRRHVEQQYWRDKLSDLFSLVVTMQHRLSGMDDFLLQNEIGLIDDKKHRQDFFATVQRKCILDSHNLSVDADSSDFYTVLADMITQDDVHSVSCPFGGLTIWRILVTEQIKRSQRLGLPPDEAFPLYGPDTGLNDLPEDWGGYVHIPYEGMHDGEVVFLPGWRVFHTEKAGIDGSLAKAMRMQGCRYLFVPKSRELGDLPCATREKIGNWVLYRQNPYHQRLKGITLLDSLQVQIKEASELIASADALLITAGAGMGVDSGLPDFRGNEGFWNAYPALAKANIKFYDIASPNNFSDDPKLAWGFYGHRLQLYRNTQPHAGFSKLLKLAANKKHGYFVFTSNVDGQFQKAGFDPKRICECHGSIHHLQCQNGCLHYIWKADAFLPEVDVINCQLLNSPPQCDCCGEIARPNILMFNDFKWEDSRYRLQRQVLSEWLAQAKNVVIIELGAGKEIPTVRHYGEMLGWPLIRINPRDPDLGSSPGVSLPMGALDGLSAIFSIPGN